MQQQPSIAETKGAHSFRGMLLFMLGVFLFACMDSATKILVADYNVPLVVAIRYIGNCLLMVVLLAPSQGTQLVRTQRTGLVLARAACLSVASLLLSLAFQRMPVAEATAIVFLAPLLVTMIAGPVLGERVGLLGWIAVIAGFCGILLIAHPGADLDLTGALFAFGAALASVGYQTLSRVLATTETTLAMLFHTALVGAVIYGLYLPWSWSGPAPTALQTGLFLSLGAMGGLGHFLFTAAHRNAPASLLAPMMYSQLVWAGVLGWLIFDHVPAGMSIVGMGIIALSGMLVALRSRITRRTLSEPIE